MIEWEVLGLAAITAVVIYYWYNPSIFKIHSEKGYPENYAKHPDPHHYKKDYR